MSCCFCSQVSTQTLSCGCSFCDLCHSNLWRGGGFILCPKCERYLEIHEVKAPVDDTCSICLGSRTNPEALPCGHVFCRDCVRPWINTHHDCPVCRVSTNPTPPESKSASVHDASSRDVSASRDVLAAALMAEVVYEGSYAPMRRRRRRRPGICIAIYRSGARRGQPCTHKAKRGSSYCGKHGR